MEYYRKTNNTYLKYLLINPPIEIVLPTELFSIQPFALLKIGNYLKNNGHYVQFIDCMENVTKTDYKTEYENERKPIRYLRCGIANKKIKPVYLVGYSYENIESLLQNINFRPDKIFIGSYMTYYYKSVHEVVKICKNIFPGSSIEIGGIYPTLTPEHARTSQADVVCEGLFENKILFKTDISLLNKKPDYAIIKFTRGCPNKCSYCAVSILEGNKVFVRDIDETLSEVSEIVNEYKITNFHFWESSILIKNSDFLKKLLKGFINRKLNINLEFPEGLQINLIDNELIDLLAKCNVTNISLPLENINLDMNKKRFHRNLNLEHLLKVTKKFRNFGIDVKLFCLVGLPNQTLENILETILFCWKNNCKAKIMNFTPIPGTEEYNRYKELIKDKDLSELDPMLYPFADEEMVDDLEFIYNNFDCRCFNPQSVINCFPENNVIKTMKKAISKKNNLDIAINKIADRFKCFNILENIQEKYNLIILGLDVKKNIKINLFDPDDKKVFIIVFEYDKNSKPCFLNSKNFNIWYDGQYINDKITNLIYDIAKEDNKFNK